MSDIVGLACRAAIVDVNVDVLLAALRLPSDTKVWAVQLDPHVPGVVKLTVEHPDLPLMEAGATLPRARPMLKSRTPEVPPIVEFDSWGC